VILGANFQAFAKAVMIGILSAACLPTIVTLIVGVLMIGDGSSDSSLTALYLIFLPAILAFCFVLPCSLAIGLPVTVLLGALKRESPEIYAVTGGLTGTTIPSIVIWNYFGAASWWLILFGFFSGATTGWVWGTERRSQLEDVGDHLT
jgi:hypothetical protein